MWMRATLFTLLVVLAGCAGAPSRCDVWIRGGTVVDGSGAAPRRADVLLVGDRVVFVGDVEHVEAGQVVDASGRVVTPGFVDPHAHGDPRRTPGFANFVAMGVTTICLGQDGSSPGGGALAPWLEAVERGRFSVNVAPLVGHGTVRRLAGVGLSAEVDEAGLAAMEELVRAAMRDGAFGLSTGLEYEPGRFAGAAELLRVARPVAEGGGVVMSHVRSEDDDRIEASLQELLEQCRGAGCRAHVSHLKVVYGRDASRADAVLALLERARREGVEVTADVYPYAASYTGVSIVFPPWARPPNDYEAVVRDRREELAAYLRERVAQRNGPTALVLGSGPWAGKSLHQVAEELAKPFEQVLIDDLRPGGPGAAHFVMADEVVRALLVAPGVVVGSDGSPTMRHPRGHGTFAKVLREYVVERELLSLAEAVHKMTGAPATVLGLDRQELPRGQLRAGWAADVVVFAPDAVRDEATFEQPYRRATGFDRVFVNGQQVLVDGDPTDARPGRLLRRRGASPAQGERRAAQ